MMLTYDNEQEKALLTGTALPAHRICANIDCLMVYPSTMAVCPVCGKPYAYTGPRALWEGGA